MFYPSENLKAFVCKGDKKKLSWMEKANSKFRGIELFTNVEFRMVFYFTVYWGLGRDNLDKWIYHNFIVPNDNWLEFNN